MPAPRDLGAELGAILSQNPQLLETLLSGATNYGGALANTNFNNASSVLFGNLDEQAFLRSHPEFQEGWDREGAAGADQSRWLKLAIDEASYIKPSELPYSGGLLGSLEGASTRIGNIQADANTQQRKADINDVATLGGSAAAAFDAANPGLAAARSQLTNALGGLDLTGTGVAGSAGNANWYRDSIAAGTPAGKMDVGGGIYIDAPTAANSTSFAGSGALGARPGAGGYNDYAGDFLGMASGARGLGSSPLLRELESQALSDLRLGGSLSAGETRLAQQASRKALGARGLAMGRNAAAEELLSTDALSRQRLNERRAFARDIDASGLNARLGAEGLAVNYAGLANNARQATNRLAFDYSGLGETARQFDASRTDNRLNSNRSFALNATSALAGLSADPYSLVLGRSSAPSAASSALNQAGGYGVDTGAFLNELMSYGGDLNNTNFNAAAAAELARRNNKSSLWGSALGAIGTIGGSFIGAPWLGAVLGGMAGGAAGGSLGSINT